MKVSYKLFLILGLSVLCASVALAQEPVTMSRQATGQIISYGTVDGYGPKPIVGRPYSADSETEISQTLADGTHIDQKTMATKVYRDSQGRTRTEHYLATNMQTGEAGRLVQVMIHDPVAGVDYILNPQDHTARQLNPTLGFQVATGANGTGVLFPVLQPKIADARDGTPTATITAVSPALTRPTRTEEDLGTQTIEGLVVDGKRTTRTIPVGAEGNDRPMEMVTETWFSNDLKILVLSKTSSPRFGEQTMRLTNIVRAEPDPSLFQVPPDYTITQQ
jgi:hypothetical protein